MSMPWWINPVAWLRVLLDWESASHGFDMRLWPTYVRLYHQHKPTTSGVEHRVGLYRFARWERAIEWWRVAK